MLQQLRSSYRSVQHRYNTLLSYYHAIVYHPVLLQARNITRYYYTLLIHQLLPDALFDFLHSRTLQTFGNLLASYQQLAWYYTQWLLVLLIGASAIGILLVPTVVVACVASIGVLLGLTTALSLIRLLTGVLRIAQAVVTRLQPKRIPSNYKHQQSKRQPLPTNHPVTDTDTTESELARQLINEVNRQHLISKLHMPTTTDMPPTAQQKAIPSPFNLLRNIRSPASSVRRRLSGSRAISIDTSAPSSPLSTASPRAFPFTRTSASQSPSIGRDTKQTRYVRKASESTLRRQSISPNSRKTDDAVTFGDDKNEDKRSLGPTPTKRAWH